MLPPHACPKWLCVREWMSGRLRSPEDWVCECRFIEREGWLGGRASGLLLSPGDKMERRGC